MIPSRALSSLRHLCSLGLPAEMLVPQFLAAMDETIPADVHSFVWHGPELEPLKLFTDASAVRDRAADVQEFLATLALGRAQWAEVKAAALAGAPHPLLTRIFGFFEDEIRRPLGMTQEVVGFLPTVGGHSGSIYLWRGGCRDYSPEELAFFKAGCRYLSYALAAPAAGDKEPMDDQGSSGLVLLDPSGALLQTDEVAERLLTLAVDAPYGFSFRQDGNLSALWRRLCRDLDRLTAGRDGPLPQEYLRSAWGMFVFRASWLRRPGTGDRGLVAAIVTLRVPQRIRLWRAIHALHLPPRQQEVAFLFAQGISQSDIATRLNVARTTVIDHVRRLYGRLGIPADRNALRAHLLDDCR